MLCNSLFYYHMLENGLTSYKDESTRDIICIDFAYSTRSYDKEMEHLENEKKKATDPEKIKRFEELIEKAKKNKYLFRGMTKDEIREDFYVNGVPIVYRHVNKKTGEVTEETIVYRMLFRNASKAKTGMCMFINEKLYDHADDWLTMGLRKKLPHDAAKIVELSAYAPLSTSTIVDRFHMSLDEVLILDDEESAFRAVADIVKSADYETTELVVDEEATEKAKQKAINKNKIDLYGNPIFSPVMKRQPCIKKRCVVEREETDVINNVWDGMGLIESSFSPGENNGMVLLRNHFFKACAFKAHIQQFFKDYCFEHGIDYDTFTLTDIFGRKILAKNIKLITNRDACKWWKFIDIMGGTKEAAFEYWKCRVEADGCIWGVVKQDHPSKLGDNHEIQQLSYQMINTLPCTKEDIFKIAETSTTYVRKLKEDNTEFVKYLRNNANIANCYDMLADLYEWNPEFGYSEMWKHEKTRTISKYVYHLRKGKITVPGDNLTMCGNPYALLLYTVGEKWEDDPTLKTENGVIQCYTTRFEDGEYLCAIRSPHNAPSNTGYFKNVRHPLMEKYMDFSPNIVAVNCIGSDVQARLNGCDFDADSVLVTNQPEMVEAARVSYRDYPTVVNDIGQSNKTYKNEWTEYAKMDSSANKAQMGIGLSSNLAQLSLTYLWTKKSKGEDDEEAHELYHNCIILAVLAQILIDGIKRTFEVDAMSEIERIKQLPSMVKLEKVEQNGKEKMVRKDLPVFMKFVKEVLTTKNGKSLDRDVIAKGKGKIDSRINHSYVCPMNWLEECLNKLRNSRRSYIVPNSTFYVYMPGKGNKTQMGKIRKIVENYDKWVRSHLPVINDFTNKETFDDFCQKSQGVIDEISKMKISVITMNRLIGSVLGIDNNVVRNNEYKDATKYIMKTLNILYQYDKEKFLKNFKTPDDPSV